MKILLVEDEPRIANLIIKGLAREHLAADHAPDAQTALLMAEMSAYSLFIIDVGLPGSMDGFALCETLRRRGIETPVLFLTARDSLGDKLTGFDRGGDDYLVKPFAFAELGASHQLRTPLTVIRTTAELALGSKDPEEWREALVTAVAETDNMSKIVEALADLARMDYGDAVVKHAPFSVAEVVEESCHTWHPSPSQKV